MSEETPENGELFEAPASEVYEFCRGVMLSLSAIASEFQCSRETIRNCLDGANVQPAGTRMGHAVYRLRDALTAWLRRQENGADSGTMDPFRRHAQRKAELLELELAVKRGQLFERRDIEAEFARNFGIITLVLDTLPDILERDHSASADQIARIEQAIDEARENIFLRLTNEGANE